MKHEEEKGKLRRQVEMTGNGSFKKKKFCRFTKGEHEFELDARPEWNERLRHDKETVLEYYQRQCTNAREEIQKKIEEEKSGIKVGKWRRWSSTTVWVDYKCKHCGKVKYQTLSPDDFPFEYQKKRKQVDFF